MLASKNDAGFGAIDNNLFKKSEKMLRAAFYGIDNLTG